MLIHCIVSMMMLTFTCTAFCMEDDSSVRVLAKEAAIGTVAGAAEVTANSPLIYFKNAMQQGHKISMDPKVWYRGYGMNVTAMGPTTAIQICTDRGLETVVPGTDLYSKVARAFTAGALSATVNGPIELVIRDQQEHNGTALATCKKVLSGGGLRAFGRGWAATALREGGFATGYLVAFPMAEEAIKKAQDAAQSNIEDPWVKAIVSHPACSYVGAGAATGIAFAVATHPCDTVKTKLQADYQGALFKNTQDVVRTVIAQKGVAGLFAGASPRAVRAGLAIPLIGTIKKYFSEE